MGNQNSRNFNNIENKISKTNKNSDNKNLTDELQQNSEENDCMSRTASGADISETTQLVPIEKLSEILQAKTYNNFGVKGILSEVFVTHVFSGYSDLGQRLFQYFHQNARAKTVHLGEIAFRQQCEQFLGIMDDSRILAIYVQFYANSENPDVITKNGVMSLLRTCFTVAMSHYSGQSKMCPMTERTISAVIKSIFFSQETLSVGFVCRWIEQNCIRLVLLLHKFCVHTLATIYRGLEQSDISYGVELLTPVLEQGPEFSDKMFEHSLMPLSQAWLLAGALPPLYSKPQIVAPSGATNTTLQVFKNKLSPIPSHWTLLYDSNQHGAGANRFLHHVLGYKGPTLILLHTKDEQTYCIASPTEWKETHLYTGGEGSCILQLLPKIDILEKKPNILCLNTSIRGYPKGLRAGSDPRKPILAVDEHFENIDCKGIPAVLLAIEVWGCGDKSSLDVQIDIKKWQIKEAERQRTVKLTAADWMDHPDRYLLELGGRPNYNN